MTPKFDERRRRYVPLDTELAFGRFGVKLHEKWAMEGLCSWMLLLAAAKRERDQGTFTYTSEPEAWGKLGAVATGFTFGEFVTFCGRSKKTRRTVVGRVSYVEIIGWAQWNDAWDKDRDALRKSRKRGGNTPDILPPLSGSSPDVTGTEGEVEVEDEVEGEAVENCLPIAVEKNMEIDKILKAVRGADKNSFKVLQSHARGVSFAALCRVRDSCERKRPVPRVGYAVAALKDEAKAKARAAA